MPTDLPPKRLCGTMPAYIRQLELKPQLRQAQRALEAATLARRASGPLIRRGLLRIPTVVHVVFKTNAENLSDARIQSQIEVLNRDFRATNGDLNQVPNVWKALATDSQIEFVLSEVTRTPTQQDEFHDVGDPVKFATSGGHDVVEPDRFLNIWVCNLQPWLGYAYFPGIDPEIDGVVIGYRSFGVGGGAPYDLGRTATHEIGHYLNLHHIWGGDSPTCSDTDFVDDTPNQEEPNYGRPAFPHLSCNNAPNGDMFMNYMDYVDDVAMFMFTAGQVLRMRTALSTARPKLGQ